MTGLHKKIQYSFLLVGHTKFSPDACFGMLKKRFRRTKVSCLDDFANVVRSSADINHAQLVGTQSGEVVVPTYDWCSFLSSKFRKLVGIKRLHHIVITFSNNTQQSSTLVASNTTQHQSSRRRHANSITTSQQPTVQVQEYSDSPAKAASLLKDRSWNPLPTELPPVIQPAGLSSTRQWYLYNEIRQYCTDSTKDQVCPLPTVPPPGNAEEEEEQEEEEEDEEDGEEQEDEENDYEEEQVTAKRRCGVCRHTGHNARTCPLK